MNQKFYDLPPEKQQKIINSGYKVFSQNSYKKSPMSEIAAEAGISKSLLFHYFRNKKELYLFLWNQGCELTIRYLNDYHCYEPADLFEMMERGMRAKFKLMELYPDIAAFTIKAFYEKDTDVRQEIQESYRAFFDRKAERAITALNPEDFVPGLDLQIMYREMYWAAEGYLWEMLQRGGLNADTMEQDWKKLLQFWKSIYANKEKNP